MSSLYLKVITTISTIRDNKSRRLKETLEITTSLPLSRLSINKAIASAVISEEKRKIILNKSLFQIG